MTIAIYDKHFFVMGGGENYIVRLADHLSDKHDVTVLTGKPVSELKIEDRFGLKVKFKVEDSIYEEDGSLASVIGDYDLFINASFGSTFVNKQAGRSWIILFFPPVFGRLSNMLKRFSRYLRFLPVDKFSRLYTSTVFLDSYDKLISISEFSHDWTQKLYSKDSSILYPPVNTEEFIQGDKRNIILSVGRFFVGGHNKKQIEMIRAFKSMYDANPELKDYKYYLCGGTRKESIHQEYLNACIKEAEGYPIHIMPDIKFSDLKDLYSKAQIFWHASGLGEDPDLHPEKFEHFGITTVEAMSSGVVPVVYGMAGQKEVVEDGVNGFLWKSVLELQEKTLELIRDEDLRGGLKERALKGAEKYSLSAFEQKVDELITA